MQKIYILDDGVYGCIFVIATSKEEALDIIIENTGRNPNIDRIFEQEIFTGFIYENGGDR